MGRLLIVENLLQAHPFAGRSGSFYLDFENNGSEVLTIRSFPKYRLGFLSVFVVVSSFL